MFGLGIVNQGSGRIESSVNVPARFVIVALWIVAGRRRPVCTDCRKGPEERLRCPHRHHRDVIGRVDHPRPHGFLALASSLPALIHRRTQDGHSACDRGAREECAGIHARDHVTHGAAAA